MKNLPINKSCNIRFIAIVIDLHLEISIEDFN